MKKTIPFLLFLYTGSLISCSSGDGDDITKDSERPASYLSPQAVLFHYEFPDPRGFERHPSIDNLSFHEPVTIEVDEYASLTFQDWSAGIKSQTQESEEKAVALLEEINACGSSVGQVDLPAETNRELLIGIQNSHLWIGEFDQTNRSFIQEWKGKEITDRLREVHIGYGEYENHYLRSLYGHLVTVNDKRFIHTYYRGDQETPSSGYYGVILLNDRIHLLDFPGIENLYVTDILPWYEESALLLFHSGEQAVVKSEKEIGVYSGYYASSYETYPVSYTEYLIFNVRSYGHIEIGLFELGSEESIFAIYVDQYESLFTDNPLYEVIYQGETNGLFTFRIDLTHYSGEKETLTLRIDREGNLHE
ncbi:MAG: hypothetical protein LIP05_06100 [Tannerellaceae bacterium]|nr:hypothetical protein [Tannerellaceae bacterium]